MNVIFGIILLLNQVMSFIKLSDDAQFGLLTCAPGDELYSAFGHTALRLCDYDNNIDVVYNYGTFSFNTDNFYYKFVKGETDYILGKEMFNRFVIVYNYFGRNVYEHRINLTQEQKQTLFEMLETNYLPENRTYRYVYLNDNCSSRVRDLMYKLLGDKLVLNDTLDLIPSNYSNKEKIQSFVMFHEKLSYREILDMYLSSNKWNDFAIDLVLGQPIDEKADMNASMFIPDFLMSTMCHYQIKENDTLRNLLDTPILHTEYYAPLEAKTSSDVTDPMCLFWIVVLLVLVVSFVEFKFNMWIKPIDAVIFAFYGLFGIVMWFISYVSIHPGVCVNFNTFWVLPTHLLFAVVIFIPRIKKVVLGYSYFIAVLTLILLVAWPIMLLFPNHQVLNCANIPLMLLPMIRAVRVIVSNWYKAKKI